MTEHDFIAKWRNRRDVYHESKAVVDGVLLCDAVLNDYFALRQSEANEPLSIAQAADRAKRTRSTIEKAIRTGRIKNVGRKHKPLVRAGDVDAAFRSSAVAPRSVSPYDPGADARALLARRGG